MHSFLARKLWHLGYAEQAVQHSQESLRIAQDVSQPYGQVFALLWTAVVHQFRREVAVVEELTERALSLSTEHGYGLFSSWGTIIHGWSLAMQGQVEAGRMEMRQGLETSLEAGSKQWHPYFLVLLAEVDGGASTPQAGLSTLVKAVDMMRTTEERFYEAEMYRVKGDLLLMQAVRDESQALVCLQEAIQIARAQQAKSLELRAAMSLARLWQQQSQRDEAYDLLAPVYSWFTEGFDTADLQDAKRLLDELNTEIGSPTA